MSQTKHDIFLSYSSKDANRVKPIVSLLEKQGWQVWWDPKIPHGTRFDAYIEEQLNNSMVVVVIWSKHSVQSKWVRAEANDGENRNVLFPIKIDEVKPSLIFRALQTTNLVGWKGDGKYSEVQELLTSIKQKIPPQNTVKSEQLVVKPKPKIQQVIHPQNIEEKSSASIFSQKENRNSEQGLNRLFSEEMKKIVGIIMLFALGIFG